jgi:hypothetical protein
VEQLLLKKSAFDQFVFRFQVIFRLSKGVSYDYYFEVLITMLSIISVKSSVFSNRVATDEENEDQITTTK